MERGDESAPVLRLCEVTVRYGDRIVLDLPELSVATGEVVAIMGPNGAGKSTLLHVAALLQRPQSGEVWITGERAAPRTARRLRRSTAMVLQEPLLFDVSVLANAASGLGFRGVRRQEAERRARQWLAQFGVGHLAPRNARTLSGGEAQRTSLARAFAVEPRLLLLDEPFAALDATTREALVPELAARLRETRTAAVIVTHDAAEARALADRLLVLIDGCIAQGDRTNAVTWPTPAPSGERPPDHALARRGE
jgi:tungstate transport system ATP-binding protein